MKLYILVSEVNEYDQYGQYFRDVWDHKPSEKELDKALTEKCGGTAYPIEEVISNLINNGGGRIKKEWEWFYLLEINK